MSVNYSICVKTGHTEASDNNWLCDDHRASAMRAVEERSLPVHDRDGRGLLPGRTYGYCGRCGGWKPDDANRQHDECLDVAANARASSRR